MNGRRAILIDRDGTLCADVGYLTRADDLRLIDGGAEAVRRANQAGFQAVVVTNQSGVARGKLDELQLSELHDKLRDLLAEEDARLDGIYYCPHHPTEGRDGYRQSCSCRKPASGMLFRARDEMGIDLAGSYMIGDRGIDVAAGAGAGTSTILVLTGAGRREQDELERNAAARPTHVAPDLLHAVAWILDRERSASN